MAGVPAINDLIGGAPDETWRDRLRDAVYVSPKGERYPLLFRDLSRSFNLRGQPYEYAGINGAYVQQRGYGPRTYPWRILFSGDDHDREALAFEAALLEHGVGRLEHPLYGTIPKVVPLGEVTRREDLVSGRGESVIELTWWTTTGSVYPNAQSNPVSEIESALAGFGRAAARDFDDGLSLDGVADRASLLATINDFLDKASAAMGGVSASIGGARNGFEAAASTVRRGMDTLIGAPLQLAAELQGLINAPGNALLSFEKKFQAFERLAASIYGSEAGRPSDSAVHGLAIGVRSRRILNDLRASDLMAGAAVGASVGAATGTEFGSRGDALKAAANITSQMDDFVAWRDAGFAVVGAMPTTSKQVDTGASYQALHRAASLAAGRLVEVSFDLQPGKRLVLGHDTTIINLCSRLYGSVSPETLDYMIDTNDLNGNDILGLPRGRSILYYPQS